MSAAVVLLSGGLDSATCAAIAKKQHGTVFGLTFDYGQRHRYELECALRISGALQLEKHDFVSIPLNVIGGSALTSDIAVPKSREIDEDIPITYVPARNLIFLSVAVAYAEAHSCSGIYIGANSLDYSGYPDCRPEFIEAFQRAAALGTKCGDEGNAITIHAPLIDLSKAEIIQKGLSLGIDYGITSSCYDPVNNSACGECDACQLRAKGFTELGIKDPALL